VEGYRLGSCRVLPDISTRRVVVVRINHIFSIGVVAVDIIGDDSVVVAGI